MTADGVYKLLQVYAEKIGLSGIGLRQRFVCYPHIGISGGAKLRG
jgi:hypothetical protein